MNDVIKEQIVKLIRKNNRDGLILAVIAGTIMLLAGFGGFPKGAVILLNLVGFALFGMTIGLWSTESDLRSASISMGLWADKKELKKAIKEK